MTILYSGISELYSGIIFGTRVLTGCIGGGTAVGTGVLVRSTADLVHNCVPVHRLHGLSEEFH